MSKKSGFVCIFEYAALRTACAVVNAIPYPLACALARGIAAAAVTCGFKKARTLERIRTCFPEKSRAEALAIARHSLANVLINVIEMIRAPSLTKDWISRHVKDVAVYADRLREIIDEGKGAVIMVPHAGNWYMAAWAMAQYGIPLSAIAARQRNPRVDAWMKRQYGSIHVVERGRASVMRDILGILKSGRGFAILPDLRVPQPDVEVPFLNGTANVSHGGALFAVATGAPIVVAIMRREHGLHTFEYLATLRPDPAAADHREEARRLTRAVFELLDAALRRTPEQWFWYNKRWILQPAKKKRRHSVGERGRKREFEG
ncbi:MAG: lysophospholipid acyltransferase family protein [Kiritimatiellia bacterium]